MSVTEAHRSRRGLLDEDGDLSDAMFTRLLRSVAWVIITAVLVVAAIAGTMKIADVWGTNDKLNAVDAGFLQDMIDHHQQAIDISRLYLKANVKGPAAPYAAEVVFYQQIENDRMDGWLRRGDRERGAPNRLAMVWMGMPSPVGEMPGMQTMATLADVGAATGDQAARLFFQVMTDHHLGGAHMAEFAATNGANTDVTDFAERMARNQRVEIIEYRQAMERLGLAA